jgi:hypothetical protein
VLYNSKSGEFFIAVSAESMILPARKGDRIRLRVSHTRLSMGRPTMLDITKQPDSVTFDITRLMNELSFITGPYAASMMRRLADALDLDLISFFPDSSEETHVHQFIEFLRRIEKAKIVYTATAGE